MYDVVYLDQARRSRVVAEGLQREIAVSVARTESRRRRVGRMFLAGSETGSLGQLVVIVDSERRAA